MSPKALGGIGTILSGLALWHGMKTTSSLWPGVALFCLSGLLACVAAAIEAAAESSKHEAELDKMDASEVFKRELVMVAEHLQKHDQKIEHLEKKDALNALG